MLEMAEYLVTAATVIVLFGVATCVAAVTQRQGAKAETRSRALVAVGDGPAEALAAGGGASPQRRSSLGWWATAFQIAAVVLLTAYIVGSGNQGRLDVAPGGGAAGHAVDEEDRFATGVVGLVAHEPVAHLVAVDRAVLERSHAVGVAAAGRRRQGRRSPRLQAGEGPPVA